MFGPEPKSVHVLYVNSYICTWRPRSHIHFPPDLILYLNLVAKGAPKFFTTLAPWPTAMDIPYFADAYRILSHRSSKASVLTHGVQLPVS
jgi:hypothetical protein